MGKQVLRKCLTPKPQSESKMWISLPNSRSILDLIAASLRRYAGKANRPKTSVNLTIGTNKNSGTWF